MQAGGDDLAFDPLSPDTFRSLRCIASARKPVHPSGIALAMAGGYSWSIEGEDGPTDPHLWTALALARFPLPEAATPTVVAASTARWAAGLS